MYKPPTWHKIGQAVNQTLSKEEMLKKADADYEVILSPVQVEDLTTGKFVTVEDRYVTGRLDPITLELQNWEVVKGRYQVVSNEVIIDKFTDNQETYTIDYFYKIGFKVNKEYDVSGLENANGAWFGFWKNSTGKSIDYEVRFYPDHQSALDYGLKYVDEVIGDDAILKKSSSSWTEGIQDRRTRSD